jgi:hypothetical protein
MNDGARVILALAAAADDEFIWNHLRVIQADMFGAGPVSSIHRQAMLGAPSSHPAISLWDIALEHLRQQPTGSQVGVPKGEGGVTQVPRPPSGPAKPRRLPDTRILLLPPL